MKTINKQSHIPYYAQLADILREIIQDSLSGDETEFLPSENELVSTYQVSRATVRQALSLLEREGLVHKVRGKGTFISTLAGEVLTEQHIRAIRPGLGLPPKYYSSLLGIRVSKDILKGTPLTWDIMK